MFGKFFSTLAVTAVLAAIAPVYAQDFVTNTPCNMPQNQMNLTAKQQQQMQKIADKYAVKDARQAMQASRPFSQEMQDIITTQTFDESKARDLLMRRNQVQNEMQLRMMRRQHEMYQVLTPKQRQLWQENRERRGVQRAQGGMMKGGRMQGQGMMQGQSVQPCMKR